MHQLITPRSIVASFLAAWCLLPPPAAAQEVLNRPHLDVIYVPTPNDVVERMLSMAQVRSDDYVIDLGSGDGRVLVAAAKNHGARGFGVDIDPERVKEARQNAQTAGVADRVEFRQQNLFETPIRDATVLTMYLMPDVNLKLRPRILSELRPGARVVSHDFDMGTGSRISTPPWAGAKFTFGSFRPRWRGSGPCRPTTASPWRST